MLDVGPRFHGRPCGAGRLSGSGWVAGWCGGWCGAVVAGDDQVGVGDVDGDGLAGVDPALPPRSRREPAADTATPAGTPKGPAGSKLLLPGVARQVTR